MPQDTLLGICGEKTASLTPAFFKQSYISDPVNFNYINVTGGGLTRPNDPFINNR